MTSQASARANRLSRHILANAEPAGFSALKMNATAGADGAMDDIDVDRVSYGFMASQALFAGLALGVFDHIAAKKGAETTIEDLQQATGVNAPRLQTLVTALAALKALKRGSSGYTLSNNSAMYLVRSSKYFYGDYIRMQVGSQFYRLMTDLSGIVKTGQAPDYQQLFSDPKEADTYTTAQHNGSLATAKQLLRKINLEGAKSMLDIGGGSGAFSIVTARKVSTIKATVLEFPEVCKTGRRFVAAEPADVAARVNYVEGSCLDPWPEALGTNHDVVLISYVSESVPAEAVPEMYRRSFERLKSGGLLIVHSFMVDDSLDGPELGALWSLQHVAVNAGGMGLHPKMVSGLMKEAGFTDIWHNDMIGGMTKLVVGKKP